jgi:hypothetical protein
MVIKLFIYTYASHNLLKCGIRQLSYYQGKKLLNKNMKVEHVFYVPTLML